ncbi:MAG: hypothetical protein K1X28_03405 [Parachlamydiales bacterium]|nr:hypothetical protein [Parachlamydiales bacterium]
MISKAVQTGKTKEFLTLFFPVLLIAFTSSLYLMVEKLLFGAFSTVAMEAAVAVAYIAQIFQLSTVAIAMMSQVFIGQQYGEKNWKDMGPCLWQYIWFSILSICIVVPAGLIYGTAYLKGMPFEEIATPYLFWILLINFLYPLGTALSCFYIAQGKTRLVLFSSISAQVLKVGLAYLIIPALAQISPLWGLYGGVISTFLAQSLFVLVLFGVFLRDKYAKLYDSRNFGFRLKLFLSCVHPGLLRASNRILNTLCWTSITHMIITKTEAHLLVFSIGGVIFLFLPFLSDAICQAQTVIVSRLVGAKNFSALLGALRPGFICSTVCIGIFGIPLLLFPGITLEVLFPKISLDPEMIRPVFAGLWASFAFFTWLYVPLGYILAFKDMLFSAFMGVFGWFNGFLYMYLMIEQFGIGPKYFWLALSLMHGSNVLMYYFRAKWLCSRALRLLPQA